MSKELTEKFKAGKLPLGYYYVDNYIGWSKEVERIIIKYTGLETEQAQAKEVLAPVPSYDEIKCLQEQLKEANAIIEDMRPFIQASMSRQTFTRILNYEDKCGVK